MIAAPDCVMEAKTDPRNGEIISVRVCAWCQKEKREGPRLAAWLRYVSSGRWTVPPVTHGICPTHAALTVSDARSL